MAPLPCPLGAGDGLLKNARGQAPRLSLARYLFPLDRLLASP